MGKAQPLSLVFAIPDHPWVDAADGAAVRIAMTVGAPSRGSGRLLEVIAERPDENGEVGVEVRERAGAMHADLRMGADVASAQALRANSGLSCPGFKLHGAGFIVTPEQARDLGLGTVAGLERHIRPYRNGRDLTDKPRGVMVIDLFGLAVDEVRARFPAVYQHVLDRVKPERDAKAHTKDGAAYARLWWVHGKPRQELRRSLYGLDRYIATVETAKHRTFQFLDAAIAPDNMLICIALDDAHALGVLSSTVHVAWALAAGGTLEDRPRYNKTRCFDPFPFPVASEAQAARIRDLAEQLDAHRKRQQAAHPGLTLTGIYNVLEKLRSGEALSAKERAIHEQGLVSVLRQLHDELDFAVLDAYGWNDLAPLLAAAHAIPNPANAHPAGRGSAPDAAAHDHAASVGHAGPTYASEHPAGRGYAPDAAAHEPAASVGHVGPTYASEHPVGRGYAPDAAARAFDEAILERLVALNAARAAEEARGLVRWLRPDFQNPQGTAAPEQAEMDAAAAAPASAATRKQPWPKDLPDQVRAVADVLAAAAAPLDEAALAERFSARGRWRDRLPLILDTLVAIGRARREDGGRYAAS